MSSVLGQFILPGVIAGVFGVVGGILTAKLSAAAESKRVDREIQSRLADWQRDFAQKYAELRGNNEAQARYTRQQFAGAFFYYASATANSERFFIPPGTKLTIGRGDECDLCLQDNENTMSKTHALVELLNDELWLTDLNSRNGTFVNGDRIQSRVALTDRAILRFGQVEVIVRHLGTRGSAQ